MSRSSDRATTEPLAALVAMFAIAAGLTLYSGVLDTALVSSTSDHNLATATADDVERRLTTGGVVDPDRLSDSLAAIPDGYEGNVTLTAEGRFSVGPTPPEDADRAYRTVSVVLGPATVRRGRLRVSVWR